MKLTLVLAIVLSLGAIGTALADEGKKKPRSPAGIPSTAAPVAVPPTAETPEAAFIDVAKVLQSPRCMNCHPDGNAPLVGEDSVPHAMNITRDIVRVGLTCQSCHRETPVSTAPGVPPAVPHWGLPSKDTPLTFQGRTPSQLCAQIKDPAQNGGKDLTALTEHISHDALVLYGWNPGGGRRVPPLPHAVFVARFKQWADAGAPCPSFSAEASAAQ